MGIYTNKYMLESDVEDAIQSPGDIGIDLDQVEKAVAGPDGIESHRDEIEDAVEGVVGDPLEEAYMIMYESEYNYNQIMRTIGIAELNEASMGRVLVLEARDIKGFFKSARDVLLTMFKRITEAVQNFVRKLDIQAAADKKYANHYKDRIIAGGNADWSLKGYSYKNIGSDFKGISNISVYDVSGLLNTLRAGRDTHDYDATINERRKTLARDLTGMNVDSVDSVNDAIKGYMEHLRGSSEPVELNGTISGAEVVNILTSSKESASIKAGYKKVKASYDAAIKSIAKMDKEINANDYESMAQAMAVCDKYNKLLVFGQNLTNSVYGIRMKAAKEKRSQARKLAHAFVKAAPAAKNESAAQLRTGSTIFSGLNFV